MIRQNERGQSLVQVLVSVGIMGILMLAMASMQTAQSRENRALAEKLAATDLTRIISSTLVQASSCQMLFTKAGNVVNDAARTFNPATAVFPFSLYLNSIPQTGSVDIVSLATPTVSGLSNSLKIRKTNGIEVQVTSANSGRLIVHFEQTGLIRSLADLNFPISILTTPVGGNIQITGCQPTGTGGGSCPPGMLVTGINPNGTPICTDGGTNAPAGSPCGANNWGVTMYVMDGEMIQLRHCCRLDVNPGMPLLNCTQF